MTQSRWAEEFVNHPFQKIWVDIKSTLENTEVDDQTVVTSVTELARLKRVVSYLDEMLGSIDPDMTPRSIWTSFQSQAEACRQQIRSYISSKNIAHIRQANEHADNLLTYVRPYMLPPQAVVNALQKSAQTYASQLDSHIVSLRGRSDSLLDEMKKDREKASSRLSDLEKAGDRIDALSTKLFVAVDGNVPTSTKIDKFVTDVAEKSKQVTNMHADLLVDLPERKSIQTQTKNAETAILVQRKEIEKVLAEVKDRTNELDIFHEKIFGQSGLDPTETNRGLEAELDRRLEQLRELETEQGRKHKALTDRIEDLLPGATSAGLSTSYRSLKESFNKPISNYTKYFYISLGLIALGTIILAISSFSFIPFQIKFAEIKTWDEILRSSVGKAGFFIPMVWLALFSATRRSQYERLQQEYAHKEAFASSYESYKQQLQDLNSDSEDLQRELISKAVDAIAYNASVTLAGKHHDEKPPLAHLLRKANLEQLQKFTEALKNIKSTVDK